MNPAPGKTYILLYALGSTQGQGISGNTHVRLRMVQKYRGTVGQSQETSRDG